MLASLGISATRLQSTIIMLWNLRSCLVFYMKEIPFRSQYCRRQNEHVLCFEFKMPYAKSWIIVVGLGRSLDLFFSALDAKGPFSHVALQLELLLTSLAPCFYKAIFRPHRNLLLREERWKVGSALMTRKYDIHCIKNTRPQISRDLHLNSGHIEWGCAKHILETV